MKKSLSVHSANIFNIAVPSKTRGNLFTQFILKLHTFCIGLKKVISIPVRMYKDMLFELLLFFEQSNIKNLFCCCFVSIQQSKNCFKILWKQKLIENFVLNVNITENRLCSFSLLVNILWITLFSFQFDTKSWSNFWHLLF